jgi:hypothetical protein
MRLSRLGHLALTLLLVSTFSMTTSCALAAQALSLPLKLLGRMLGAFASNPVGSAASAAALL